MLSSKLYDLTCYIKKYEYLVYYSQFEKLGIVRLRGIVIHIMSIAIIYQFISVILLIH